MSKVLGALAVIVLVLALAVANAFWVGFVVMILLGVLHSIFPAVPALGYRITFALTLLAGVVLGFIKSGPAAAAKRA